MSDITVVIPTSPIPSHPSTEVITRTLASIRRHLPDSPIYIFCDGVRDELKHRAEQYRDYLFGLMDQGEYGVSFFVSQDHRQQAGMLKRWIDAIHTPLLFFCEHDAVLDDKPIDWDAIRSLLHSGEANTVRFYWHEEIHPEHTYLMLERQGDFVKTIQWSSWPHVSRTDFYKRILADYFAGDDKKMVETTMYSPVLEHPWEQFRTWIYAPEPDAIRFHHMDARRDPVTGVKDPGSW